MGPAFRLARGARTDAIGEATVLAKSAGARSGAMASWLHDHTSVRLRVTLRGLAGPGDARRPRGRAVAGRRRGRRACPPGLRLAAGLDAGLAAGGRAVGGPRRGLRYRRAEHRSGRLAPVAVDWAALAASGRPVTAVVRIEGQLAHLDPKGLTETVAALLAGLAEKRVALAGVEIDHDCATGRLGAYAHLPRGPSRCRTGPAPLDHRPSPPGSRHLSSTGSSRLADGAVLQVHAVEAPQRGLFDPARAEEWVRAFKDRPAKRPFRVALPAYGVRVGYGETGRLEIGRGRGATALRRPRPRGAVGTSRRCRAVHRRDRARDPPPRLAGFVWFRLPTQDDRRA